jgi:hypothetical protein
MIVNLCQCECVFVSKLTLTGSQKRTAIAIPLLPRN